MAAASSPLAFLPSPAKMSRENVDPATAAPPPSRQRLNGTYSPVTSPSGGDGQRQRVSSVSSQPGSPISYPASFIDQSRALLDRQRRTFDQERLLFDQERAMWDMERQALYERIRELERRTVALTMSSSSSSSSLAKKKKQEQESTGRDPLVRKALSVQHHPHHHQTRPKIEGVFSGGTEALWTRHASQPESTDNNKPSDKFWEGSSSRQGSIPSRVFTAPVLQDGKLPTISETQNNDRGAMNFLAEMGLSPNGKPSDGTEGIGSVGGRGIDISLIQHDLDGITLKPSALSPSVMSKVRSPSPLRSPSPGPRDGSTLLAMPKNNEMDANLTKDAGHTPIVHEASSPTAEEDGAEHLHRPSLAATSHIITNNNIPDDPPAPPPLQGPLSLINESKADSEFLQELDLKLLQEARKIIHNPDDDHDHDHHNDNDTKPDNVIDGTTENDGDDEERGEQGIRRPEPDVKLRFKRSMNFGSAFGSRSLGGTQ